MAQVEAAVTARRSPRPAAARLLAAACLLGATAAGASAGPALDEMSGERWAKLREAERFQLNVAEKYFREKQWKVAADEYEKFLKLYDRSEGAPYVQMKWAHCQVHLRRLNAAIKDGYQTLLDYYPESPEAPLAALLIGRTNKDMGDLKAAKKAYAKAIAAYPKHFAAAMARLDLVEVAGKENDLPRRTALLRELTYDVERKGPTAAECVHAARLYAQSCFAAGDFEEGRKALATACPDDALPTQLLHPQLGRLPQTIQELVASTDAATKLRGERLADAAFVWLKGQATADPKQKERAAAAWYAAADVLGSANRAEKQRELYVQMLAAVGPNDVLLGRLAQWYKENKQRDKARETYAKYADATEGLSQVAASYAEEEKYDRAIEVYRKLAAQDAKAAPKWLAQAAYTYRRAGKPDQAIAVYRELLTSDAAHAASWHWESAETLYHAGRWKDAIGAYRGTENFPTNYRHMAQSHRRLKQYDEAIGLYGQIIVASPPHASAALLEIALTHEEAGRTDAAIKALKQVCDRYPKSGEGSVAHARLNDKYKITVTLGGAKD